MNHCRDCNSDYATPGTCNCFAVGGKRQAAPAPAPSYPWHPVYPWYWTTPSPFVKSPCKVCGQYDCTTMHITWASPIPSTTNTLILRDVHGNSSGYFPSSLT